MTSRYRDFAISYGTKINDVDDMRMFIGIRAQRKIQEPHWQETFVTLR